MQWTERRRIRRSRTKLGDTIQKWGKNCHGSTVASVNSFRLENCIFTCRFSSQYVSNWKRFCVRSSLHSVEWVAIARTSYNFSFSSHHFSSCSDPVGLFAYCKLSSVALIHRLLSSLSFTLSMWNIRYHRIASLIFVIADTVVVIISFVIFAFFVWKIDISKWTSKTQNKSLD